MAPRRRRGACRGACAARGGHVHRGRGAAVDPREPQRSADALGTFGGGWEDEKMGRLGRKNNYLVCLGNLANLGGD